MTRNQLRGLAGIAAFAAVALLAVPVLGVDPSRSPSTGTAPSASPPSVGPSIASPSPAAAPSKPAEPEEAGDDQGGKPDKAGKTKPENDAPEHPVTLRGVVASGSGEHGAFTLTVGSTVYTLEAGPTWWWGDANPLAAVVGKAVTIAGEQADGSNDVDVQAIDGKAIRPAGRPPWAGGWKVVGPKHPGWAQWKVDKLAGKGTGREHAPGQQVQPSPGP